jgi:hypothetical protein
MIILRSVADNETKIVCFDIECVHSTAATAQPVGCTESKNVYRLFTETF